MVFPSSNNGNAFKYTFEKQNNQLCFTKKQKQNKTQCSIFEDDEIVKPAFSGIKVTIDW